jgi:ribonuclease HI
MFVISETAGRFKPREQVNQRHIRVYFDGSYDWRHTMGIGVVIYDGRRCIWRHSGHAIVEEFNGASANLAEYLALSAALRWLLDHDLNDREIEICGDSDLVIQQMFGRWRIKHGIYTRMAREAKLLLREFPYARGRWIKRRWNARADTLSRKTGWSIDLRSKVTTIEASGE